MDGAAVSVDRIPRVLRFNVGGTVYMTSMGTLEARGPNFLTTLVGQHYGGESGMRCEVVDGALFIDRSGVAFEYVLHFLRTGNLVCGGSTSVEMLRDELAFYAIPLDLEESSKVSVSHARSLFDITEETNQSYVEAARFIETLWPLLHPFLLDRAKKGFSFALFTIKKAVVPGGNVSYSIPELNWEFVSSIDFNQSSDPWSGGNAWSWLQWLLESKPFLFRSTLNYRDTLEWSLSWFMGGIKQDRNAYDIYHLLTHVVRSRSYCGGFNHTEGQNCKCFLNVKDPSANKKC